MNSCSIQTSFVIAWGGISACCGRLFGLVTLCVELQKLDVTKFEIYVMGVWIFAAVALVFAEYAVSIGTTEARYLPTSLTTSLVHMALEFYIFFRLMWLIAPSFLSLRHRISAIGDARALRTTSLILLELLTVTPSAKFVGIVGEFIPFAIGSLFVLGAFNKPIVCHATSNDITSLPSIGLSDSTSRLPRPYKPPDTSFRTYIPDHPFGRSSSPTMQIGPSVWPRTTGSSRGSTTISTTAPSIETAMVHVTSRLRPAYLRYTLSHDDHRYTSVNHITPAAPLLPNPHPITSTGDAWGSNDISDHLMLNKNQRKNRILSRQDEYVIPPNAQHAPPPPSRPQSANSILERLSYSVLSATEQHSSPIGTAVSNQSWMSLVRTAASLDPLPLPEKSDR
ncbi:hypothetical protein BS17DRAFT_230158 [Gyrodon lividus]|nr:hypothetical protein BS17DRAFT_230158 [Gyrodon lividus]